MVIRERMLSLPTERTALFLPQITVFTGQHENSPPLGGICVAAVNKNILQAIENKTKQEKNPGNHLYCLIIGIMSLVDSCKYHLLALWIAKLSSLEGLKK